MHQTRVPILIGMFNRRAAPEQHSNCCLMPLTRRQKQGSPALLRLVLELRAARQEDLCYLCLAVVAGVLHGIRARTRRVHEAGAMLEEGPRLMREAISM